MVDFNDDCLVMVGSCVSHSTQSSLTSNKVKVTLTAQAWNREYYGWYDRILTLVFLLKNCL